ncbi:hypothetical protein A1Q2_02560 [Trichosporon asahii var. asahii CBS 8904]|uniref:Uncharacterized protein n=1 Tax=Trichosporon asahii var. asahii (strain CBS 8904) TaxID=1220162 RepID=K1VR95_TRIAC|nr:hypothetical protein A1Q2_02560 [Trichosporon asahii var. asahii CBS 8904]
MKLVAVAVAFLAAAGFVAASPIPQDSNPINPTTTMKLFTAITALIATIGFASAAPAPNDHGASSIRPSVKENVILITYLELVEAAEAPHRAPYAQKAAVH